MGLGSMFLSLGRVTGPLWAGLIFDVHLTPPYLSGGAIMAVGFIVSLSWISRRQEITLEARAG